MLVPLTSLDARRLLAGLGGLAFAESYPSTFATEVLRLVAEFPSESDAPLGPWLITRCLDDVVVGVLNCARMAERSTVTVGYEVAPSCAGQGYATEALRTLVEHLLARPEVSRVCADTVVDHVASRRVMEKAGLRWQRDDVEERDGREVTLAHYAVDHLGRGAGRRQPR